MDKIKFFLQDNSKLGFLCMVLSVLFITAIIKLPIKHFTNKIKDEKERKAINSIFVLIALGVGMGVELLYTYFTKTPFHIEMGVILGGMGICTHNCFDVIVRIVLYIISEIKHGKKIDDIPIDKIVEIINENPELKDKAVQLAEDNTANTTTIKEDTAPVKTEKQTNEAIKNFKASLK